MRLVAQRLLDAIENQPSGTEVIASGTSCRPKHMAELFAEAIA
jgi:hypothetical protein